MKNTLLRLLADERGATVIEYALIAGFLSIVIVGVVNALGITLQGTFAAVAAGF